MMPHRVNILSVQILASTLLWGVIEFLALLRSRWNDPGPTRGG